MSQSDRTTEPQALLSEQILKSARERLQPMWEMSVDQRVAAIRRGISRSSSARRGRHTAPSRSHC